MNTFLWILPSCHSVDTEHNDSNRLMTDSVLSSIWTWIEITHWNQGWFCDLWKVIRSLW